ncbi:olfactory receptor 7A5-like [Bubalus kerabau]|uniref:olfactory receptor 7A5-like n=1 Tax=Bubalus carabanensis TaxID=3119969 RepID=UPI00244F0162|nr:olfactory receptor 7A5-like [Bubalus carabanensis]
MYLIAVFGNLLIILVTISDSHLHTPMYFFLSNLSFVDICLTSTTIPKMLHNIENQSKVITYEGCIVQVYFYIFLAGVDDFLLTVMAYDRFVAICQPLHYTIIMNPRLCGLLVLVPWMVIVLLFYSTSLGVYLSSAATHSSHSSATASVMFTVVTPMLNPFIYSLRNKDIKRALKRVYGIVGTKIWSASIIQKGTWTSTGKAFSLNLQAGESSIIHTFQEKVREDGIQEHVPDVTEDQSSIVQRPEVTAVIFQLS